jgi:hypothetical protein
VNPPAQSESLARTAAAHVDHWNRNQPVGAAVWLPNGKVTKTRDLASICRDQDGTPVAGILVDAFEHPVKLSDCSLEPPKELLPLQERYSTSEIREHMEKLEHWPHIAHNLYALAKHWEYQAEKFPEHAGAYLHCAKQLRQRADWLQDDLRFVAELARRAPTVLAKLGP